MTTRRLGRKEQREREAGQESSYERYAGRYELLEQEFDELESRCGRCLMTAAKIAPGIAEERSE
jgi:hypothetical protein